MNHRLTEHDYSGRGYYFITATAYPRRDIFSTIVNYQTILTPLGEIVVRGWLRLHDEQPLLEQQEFEVKRNANQLRQLPLQQRPGETPSGKNASAVKDDALLMRQHIESNPITNRPRLQSSLYSRLYRMPKGVSNAR